MAVVIKLTKPLQQGRYSGLDASIAHGPPGESILDLLQLTRSGKVTFSETDDTAEVELGSKFGEAVVVAQLQNASGGAAAASVTAVLDPSGKLTLTLDAAPGAGESVDVVLSADGRPLA